MHTFRTLSPWSRPWGFSAARRPCGARAASKASAAMAGSRFWPFAPMRSDAMGLRRRDWLITPGMGSLRCKMATYIEAAIEVLREAKEPLHYKEITKRAQKKGLIEGAQTPAATMTSAIFSNMKQFGSKSAFQKTGKGVYKLNPGFHSPIHLPSDAYHDGDPSPSMTLQPLFTTFIQEYSLNQIPASEGNYVYGSINKRTKFIFCEKQKTLFNSAIKKCVNRESFPALYVLFDINKKEVYVGQTDNGKQRIDNHWSSQKSFTHIAVIFAEVIDSEKIRLKLEFKLSKLLAKHMTVTNHYKDVHIKPEEEHTYLELNEHTERIFTILYFLIRDLLLPPTSDPRSWIWPTTLDSYNILLAKNVWASKAPLEKISARVKPGDHIAFYIPEHRSFVGVHRAVGDWHNSVDPLWPDEIASNKKIHASQIKVSLALDGVATLDSVGNLEIFKNKGNRGLALRSSNGYPANNGKPIPDSDMRAITKNLRPGRL